MARQKRFRFDGASAYRLAMMLHHGEDFSLAKKVAAAGLGTHPKAIWLMWPIVDLQLLFRGQAQRSGTQCRINPGTNAWRLIEP
jgi:hypothetical protein